MSTTTTQTIRVVAHGKPRSLDRRDFKHHLVFGTVDPLTLPPAGLGRQPIFPIKDQGMTSFCTAYATAAAREYQEKVELSPEYQTAKISELSRIPITNGADPRTALEAAVAYGSLEQKDAPFTLSDHPDSFIADWKNWPASLDMLAAPHEAESFFDATSGPHDIFDNMRAALALAQADNGALVCTSQWYNEWNYPVKGVVPLGSSINAYGWHDWVIIDWRTNPDTQALELVAQNSYGSAYGDGGLFYLSRANINMAFSVATSGASIFRDLDPNVVQRFQLHNQSLYGIFFELLLRMGDTFAQALTTLSQMFPYGISGKK